MKDYIDPRVVKEKHPLDEGAILSSFAHSMFTIEYISPTCEYIVVLSPWRYSSQNMYKLYPTVYGGGKAVTVAGPFKDSYMAQNALNDIASGITWSLANYICQQKELINPEIKY